MIWFEPTRILIVDTPLSSSIILERCLTLCELVDAYMPVARPRTPFVIVFTLSAPQLVYPVTDAPLSN